MTIDARDGQNGSAAQRAFSVPAFFETFYTPEESAARKAIIDKIEVERQVFHERIAPLLMELVKIRGTTKWMGHAP